MEPGGTESARIPALTCILRVEETRSAREESGEKRWIDACSRASEPQSGIANPTERSYVPLGVRDEWLEKARPEAERQDANL